MICFKHQTVAAIGICKFCGKGVCTSCVADTGHGLSCRDSCEGEVHIMARMVRNNAKVLRAANAQIRSSGILMFVLGLASLAGAWWIYDSGQLVAAIAPLAFGLLFSVFGLTRITVERYPNPDERKQAE
jgi:hypothetical protein